MNHHRKSRTPLNVPEVPAPKADPLLKTLVDEDTEAAPRRWISKSFIAACVFLGLGIWQIVHVSNSGEPFFQFAAKAKAGPTNVRSEGHVSLRRALKSTDPIAAYLDRAKRGMTEQEIRWMIEDFQSAGLDEEEHSMKGILRSKQQLWYLEALTAALQLSQEQIAQARAKMDTLLAKDIETFEKGISGLGTNTHLARIDDTMPVAPMASVDAWLFKDAYAPWNLCDLTKEQDQLTMHHWREAERQSALKNKSEDPDSAQDRPWMQLVSSKKDILSGNIIDLGDSNPYRLAFKGHAMFGRILVVDAFPLTSNQKDPDDVTGLDQARCLQAPQLRMAMLMEPDAASKLLRQLDHPASQTQSTEGLGTTTKPETPADPFESK